MKAGEWRGNGWSAGSTDGLVSEIILTTIYPLVTHELNFAIASPYATGRLLQLPFTMKAVRPRFKSSLLFITPVSRFLF